jgi:thimet oligopeptidase
MKFLRLAFAVAVVSSLAAASRRVDSSPFYAGLDTPESFAKQADVHLANARQALDRLLAVKGRRTVENTLRPYDDAALEIDAVKGPADVVVNEHPDDRMRHAADAAMTRARAIEADKSTNRAVYDALAAIDASREDEETKYYLSRELRTFRLKGVDKDEATRARLARLRRDVEEAVREFRVNVNNSSRTITVASEADLDGLPADYIARQKPNATGGFTIRADDANFPLILTYARIEDVRRRMYMELANVGYPENMAVLDRMIATRAEIAHLLGFDSWAAYDVADTMAGSVKAASDFIDHVIAAARPKAAREYDELVKRKQQDVPGVKAIAAWDLAYYRELVRRANYNFDSQSLRPYFPYDRVRQGVFDVASRMYGVTFRRVDVPVWHPSVEAYEMADGPTLLGRIYLDAHPRPNKQSAGAYTRTGREGVSGRQLPEVVIQESLPGGQPGDPGLLTQDLVRDPVFHEFGHALFHIFTGRQRWFGLTSFAERDFNEAPSQMFEEWTWDPKTLATFAKHYETGAPIPPALVEKLRASRECCTALSVAGQIAFARLALSLFDRDPKRVDSDALIRDIMNAYVPYGHVEGTHRQASFNQLVNDAYVSSYYVYQWSLVIAKDMFSRFDPTDLLAPGPARRYRETILKPGGSKPAADLVKDFLGRPFNEKAWEQWLNRGAS